MAKKTKALEVDGRYIYTPELEVCPCCGEPLILRKHYQWRKTVQHMHEVAYVASRAKECKKPGCAQAGKGVVSAAGQMVTLARYTYGLDVIAQIGWWRDREHMDREEVHQRLRRSIQISEREVDYLYEQYQILLACVANQDEDKLQEVAAQRGGLIISMDGIAPEGASEQLWVVRKYRRTRYWWPPG
ncbi:MAG: hypothetical protein GY809_15070 [Planctomycetes bacterium]|nr:hypothetical protein [Planctomycetota bacterium]